MADYGRGRGEAATVGVQLPLQEGTPRADPYGRGAGTPLVGVGEDLTPTGVVLVGVSRQ